jgi:CheY-like chemotaxis protein/HPt (histidine-containing phosphotransfer) domain-containing protein
MYLAEFLGEYLMVIDKEQSHEVTNASPGSGDLEDTFHIPADSGSAEEHEQQLHILLADDVEIYREMGRVILKRLGHQVTLAKNGEEAATLAGLQTFDMIFMDIQMPVLDGLGAAARIRNNEKRTHSHVPIIAMTCPSQGVWERCLAAGMDGYLSKPVQREDVISIFRRFQQEHTDGARLTEMLSPLAGGIERAGAAIPLVTAGNRPKVSASERLRDIAADQPSDPLAAAEQLPVFDRQGLMDLLCGEKDLIKSFLELYLGSVGGYLDQLSVALFAAQAGQVHALAHSMKGAAVNMGALRVSAAALRLETLTRTGELEGAVAIFGTLMSAVVEFRGQAEKEINRESAGSEKQG